MSETTQSRQCDWPRAGVGVLLIDESGRALLTLRKLPPEAGCWSILGGKVDFLEPLEECAIREALEEAGVEIAIERLLCVTDHRLPDEGHHWVSPAFLGRIMSGEARNCEPGKTSEVRWFPLNQLPPNLTMTARNAVAAYLGRAATYTADPRAETCGQSTFNNRKSKYRGQ